MGNPSNLRGRTPLFTEAAALDLLRERIAVGAGTNLPTFIGYMQADNKLPAKISAQSVAALLSGRMFPDLIDPATGKVFDYASLPKASPGRPTAFVNGVDPVTKRRKSVPKLRQFVIDEVTQNVTTWLERRLTRFYLKIQEETDAKIAALRKEVRG